LFFSLFFKGDSVNIFEDLSKSIKSPPESKTDAEISETDRNLIEEQKPLFEVIIFFSIGILLV